MSRILGVLLFSLVFIACKSKEARTYELVQQYNDDKGVLVTDSLKHAKAYILDKRTVGLDFIFSTGEETLTEPFAHQLDDVLSQVSQKYPESKRLIKEGVYFKTRIYNRYGIKIQEYLLELDNKDILKIRQ